MRIVPDGRDGPTPIDARGTLDARRDEIVSDRFQSASFAATSSGWS